MKTWKKTVFLIVTFGLIFLLPLLGSLAKWKGLPLGYGDFPAQKVEADPGFSLLYFSLACVVALVITLVLVFPAGSASRRRKRHPGRRGKPPLSRSGSGGACRSLRLAGS